MGDLAKFNWDYSDKEFGSEYIKCTTCTADADLKVNLEMQLKDYSLTMLEVAVEGNANMDMNAEFSLSGSKTAEWEQVVTIINGPSISFPVFGIPFTISMLIPVSVGYTVVMEANTVVEVNAKGKGHVKYGFGKYSADEPIHFIKENSFSFNGGLANAAAEIDVAAEFFIMPSIEVTLAHIGGPSCGLKGSFNFLAHGSLKLPETFVNKLRAQFGERRLLGSANPIAESNTVADRRLLSSKKKQHPKKKQQQKRKQQPKRNQRKRKKKRKRKTQTPQMKTLVVTTALTSNSRGGLR